MKLTFLGHSSFLVEYNGKNLLFDPFVSGNDLASAIKVEEIKADYILLSHGHMDHVLDAETIGKRNNATIVSNFEIASYYGEKGLNHHPMNFGGSWKFDFGKVKYTPALHSSVLPDGTYGGNPGGFIVSEGEGTFYFSGDTCLDLNMQLIPKLGYKLDFAIFPIGGNFTMDLEEALIASDFVECDTIIGCHFDTFGYIKIDKDEAVRRFEEKNKKLILLNIGQSIEI